MTPSSSQGPLLIVNPRRDINDKMRCLLWLNGFDSESVTTLADATDQCRRRKHALLICRDELSDGSGTDCIQQAWERSGTPGIVMIDNYTKQKVMALTSPQALRAVLTHPFNQRDFLLAVWDVIGMAAVSERGLHDHQQKCDDCRGTGTIVLLVHQKLCLTCGGTGWLPLDILDLPLRQVSQLDPPTRFALHSSGIRTLRQAKRMTDGVLQLLLEMYLVDPQPVLELVRRSSSPRD